MVNKNKEKFMLYAIGVLLTLVISMLEASRGRALNFYIYQEATVDFLSGLNPYIGWHDRHSLDVFLYLPSFNSLFSPFAIMPRGIGAVIWNLLNFNLLFLSMVLITDRLGNGLRFLFLYSLLVVAQALFSFQYNLTIVYLFLFSFILLERGNYWLALTLIIISGTTKVYGFFELALFVLYPQFWKNVGRGSILLIAALLLPAITVGLHELMPLYEGWYQAINVHSYRPFETMTRLILVVTGTNVYDYGNLMLGAVGLVLTAAIIAMRHKLTTFRLRSQMLGIIMATIILWGTNSERNTYCIAIIGYAIWYIAAERHNMLDKILLVSNFLLICVIPIDILCPRPVLNLLMDTLALNILSMLVTWIRMCQYTVSEAYRQINLQ